MEVIQTALAAYGMSGQVFHAPFLDTNPHFRLHSIVERSKELSKERYPQARIVRGFDALLEDPEIELIVVNTPDHTHYDYTRLALEAGKHVVVEKPFTSTTRQGEELIALAEKKGRMLSVYQNRRWDADFLTIQQLLERKELGRLVEFESTFARYRNFIKPGTWKETGELGGGLTYNLGSHLIDQALVLFGMPESVYADIATMRTGGMVDDYFIIRLNKPAQDPEVKITLKASYLMCEPEPRFVLHGTEGSYVKHGVDKQETALLEGQTPDQPHWGEETEDEWGILHKVTPEGEELRRSYPGIPGNYGGFYENIFEHLRQGKPLLTDARSVINGIRIIEVAFRSFREQRTVTL
ncbi:MAG: Gfo/Idh/MocA family oxidoreductase [Bacteroides sp.]|nr:Gfo/Idh/MocA family oxidoreductase [Bacteroides sp.]